MTFLELYAFICAIIMSRPNIVLYLFKPLAAQLQKAYCIVLWQSYA